VNAIVYPFAGPGDGLPSGIDDPGEAVILQVGADARQVGHNIDADGAQVLGWPDSGQHQQLSGSDRTGAEDRLALRVNLPQIAIDGVFHAEATAIGYEEPENQRTGQYGEVRAIEDGAQVTVGGRLPGPVDDVEIPRAHTLLLTIDVVAAFVSDAHGGIAEGVRERTGVSRGRHSHGSVGAAVCLIAPFGCLALLEEWQQILVAPAGSTRRRPLVIVGVVAAEEGHCVDAA